MIEHLKSSHLPKCPECLIPLARYDYDTHVAKHNRLADAQEENVSFKNSESV